MLVFGSEYKQALGIYISSWESVKTGAGQMINVCFKENSSPRKEKNNMSRFWITLWLSDTVI